MSGGGEGEKGYPYTEQKGKKIKRTTHHQGKVGTSLGNYLVALVWQMRYTDTSRGHE